MNWTLTLSSARIYDFFFSLIRHSVNQYINISGEQHLWNFEPRQRTSVKVLVRSQLKHKETYFMKLWTVSQSDFSCRTGWWSINPRNQHFCSKPVNLDVYISRYCDFLHCSNPCNLFFSLPTHLLAFSSYIILIHLKRLLIRDNTVMW